MRILGLDARGFLTKNGRYSLVREYTIEEKQGFLMTFNLVMILEASGEPSGEWKDFAYTANIHVTGYV